MIIDKVTMTGADDSVDVNEMVKISIEHPQVEWGILASESKMGLPRYPTNHWIGRLVPYGKYFADMAVPLGLFPRMNLSLHICGAWGRNLLANNVDECVYRTMLNFDRIQLNFTLGKVEWDEQFAANLAKGMNNDKHYIFQIGKAGDNHIMRHAAANGLRVAALFDRSGGKGETPGEWPSPLNGVYCGYAGGLRPENILVELDRINEVVPKDEHIWIDMESGLRSDDDKVFDLSRVRACLAAAEKFF